MHPLVENFTSLSDADLEKKLTKLNEVLRFSTNSAVVNQALMIRSAIAEEKDRRFDAIMQKTKFGDKIKVD